MNLVSPTPAARCIYLRVYAQGKVTKVDLYTIATASMGWFDGASTALGLRIAAGSKRFTNTFPRPPLQKCVCASLAGIDRANRLAK